MIALPKIATERLLLRPLRSADTPLIVLYADNPKIAENTLNIPYPYGEQDAVYWLHMAYQGAKSGTSCILAMANKADNAFMGGISLALEPPHGRGMIGYWLAEPFWGQGYTTEAVGAILDYGFGTLGLHKIYSNHFAQNPASGKVMAKNGMVKEAELQDHVYRGNAYHTLVQYRLTQAEYHRLQKNQ